MSRSPSSIPTSIPFCAKNKRVGQGAADLGLSGITTAEQFGRLCDNLHPQTGERLTLRQKTTRIEMRADGKEREAANRRVFYDFTFSQPKSVSIAALVGHDAWMRENNFAP